MIFSALFVAVLFMLLARAGRWIVRTDSLFERVLAGMFVWAVCSWTATLFGPYARTGPALIAVLAMTPQRVRSTLFSGWTGWMFIAAGIAGGTAIVQAAELPLNFDTGAYHLQVVQWLSRFGAVPGIANFDPHFGIHSSWFSVAASIDWGWNYGRSFHVLNVLPWLAGVTGVLESGRRVLRGGCNSATLFLTVSLPWVLYFYRGAAASISPDLPAVLFACGAIGASLRYLETISPADWTTSGLLALGAFSCKLSMAPMLLLPVAMALLNGNVSFRLLKSQLPLALGAAALVAGLTVAHNHVLSGWPLFPATFFSGSSPDWQVPKAQADALVHHVRMWGVRPDYQTADVQPLAETMVSWFHRNRSIHFFPVETYGLLLIPLSAIAGAFLVPGKIIKRHAGLYGTLLCGLIYWALSSPNPRFATVWVLGLVLLPLCLIISERRFLHLQKGTTYGMLGLGAVFLLLMIPESGVRSRVFGPKKHLLLEAPAAPQGPVVSFFTIDSTEIRIPESGFQVFNAPVPAARHGVFCVKKRGPLLSNGFKPEKDTCVE